MQRFSVPIGLLIAIAVPLIWSEPQSLTLFTLWAIYVLLATGMNILWGVAGQISLGQNGLFAIGAYASAILATKLNMSVLLTVPIAMLVGGVGACIIAMPALRVRGFYLAMVTLGFGMLVQTLATEWQSMTGGVQGLENIPSPAMRTLVVAGFTIKPIAYCYASLVLAGLGIWVSRNLLRSYWGRAMAAVRDSEIAAAAQGVFVGKVKVAAFVIGGMYTALAGAIYAHQLAFVSPEAFNVDMAVLIMIMPLVGGLGTLWGPLVGAAIFLALPELLQGLWQYNLLIYGLILVGSFALFPRGVVGGLQRWFKAKEQLPEPKKEALASAMPRLAPTEQPSLVAANIGIHFGGLQALQSIDLSLMPGRVHAIIGPNGSGKSTLINVLTRIYTQSQGNIRLGDTSIDRLRPDQAARAGLARTFQNLRLFTELSALDNALIGAHPNFYANIVACALATPGARREEARERGRIAALLADFGLTAVASMHVGALPYGDQKLLELARAVAKHPRLLLLDEPAAGVSAAEIDTLRRTVLAAAAAGVAVLVIEHNMDFVMGIADTITVLDQGEKISEGTPAEVRTDPRVIEAYLGSAAGTAGA